MSDDDATEPAPTARRGRGRHRRPSNSPGAAVVRSATVTGAAFALPLTASGAAHAATGGEWKRAASAETSTATAVNSGGGHLGGLRLAPSTWAAYRGERDGRPSPGVRGTVTVRQAALRTAPETAPARPEAAPDETHTAWHLVRHGDTLSGIADAYRVPGGWQRLYRDNRSVVGSNPNLIIPGQRLRILRTPAGQVSGAITEKPATPRRPAPAPKHHEQKTEHQPAAKPEHKPEHSTDRTADRKTENKPAEHKPAEHKPAGHKPAAAKQERAQHPSRSHESHASSTAVRPVTGYFISARYHQSGRWSSGHHTGIDLAVPSGTPVHAALTGTVVRAGWDGAYGNEVLIRHADGRYSLYGHLSKIEVHAGARVTTGQRIALSGATGNVTGPHLHFEVRTAAGYGTEIDPSAWLAGHGAHL